jgi:undecaprenyl-diphosphatase
MDATTNRKRAIATVARPSVLAGLLAVWLAMLLVGGRGVDEAIVRALQFDDGPMALPIVLVTGLGDWQILLAVTAFAAAWLLYRKDARTALLLVAWTLAGRALVGLQKLTFGRIRPEDDMQLVGTAGFSFPSGHSANSTIVYLLIALLLFAPGVPRKRAVAVAAILACLIGLSRMFLGVHWPSDVVAGWAFGILWVLIGVRLAQTLNRNSNTSPS